MKKPKKAPLITEERILQISNNVSEEYADHGQTNFATRQELCEVVRYWQKKADDQWNKFASLRCDVVSLGIEHMHANP